MEDDVRKKGMLYIQQQRFGKKWKKIWSIIYKESNHSVSRMEFFEYKDSGSVSSGEKGDRTHRKQENKKIIKLRDCIRISEVEIDGYPKDCRPFLVETTEKLFVFAAENTELDGWTQALCETAFPMSWCEPGQAKQGSVHRSRGQSKGTDEGMEDNSLYCTRDAVMKDFPVSVRKTEASERCSLRGSYQLRTDFDSLLLKDPKTGDVVFTWPYRYLRRFGRDKVTFSFEAGRRCDSGEGNFEFETKQGNALFQAVETAINLQRSSVAPQRQTSTGLETPLDNSSTYSTVNQGVTKESTTSSQCPSLTTRSKLELPTDKQLTGVKSLTLDTRPPPHKSQVKNIPSCPLLSREEPMYSQVSMPQETLEPAPETRKASKTPAKYGGCQDSEYATPFDAVTKSLMTTLKVLDRSVEKEENVDGDDAADPLYDSIDEMAVRSIIQIRPDGHKRFSTKSEHIYDEPEGCAVAMTVSKDPVFFYDDPEEVKMQAWKLQGWPTDPGGHEYPYNPQIDDYAVPKPPRKLVPDLSLSENNENENTTYDNVAVKAKEKGNRSRKTESS